jgi:hypothetical protein
MSRHPDAIFRRNGPVTILWGPSAAHLAHITSIDPAWPLRVRRGYVIPAAQLDDVAAYCQVRRWLLVGKW